MTFPFRDDKWPVRFLRLSLEVSTWSKDPSSKVGCVIADLEHRIVSIGFNGFAKDIRDSAERLEDRATRLALTLHAEDNAILFAQSPLLNTHLYCTHLPCAHCASRITQVGISEVHYLVQRDYETRWASDNALAKQILREAGTFLFEYHPNELKG